MFSTPDFSVADDDGQPEQAPRMCSQTTPVSGSKREEQDVAAVLGHRRADARVQQFLDLGHHRERFRLRMTISSARSRRR